MLETVTYSEAKAQGRKRYFTGKPCRRGHVAERFVSGSCCECDREYNTAYGTANREKVALQRRGYRLANLDLHRARYRDYRAANPDKCNAADAKRRADQINATPPWLTDEHKQQIAVLYKEAARLTRETGIEHHVDHIVPLKAKRRGVRGQVACGLHAPWNLQVLPGPENLAKNCYID